MLPVDVAEDRTYVAGKEVVDAGATAAVAPIATVSLLISTHGVHGADSVVSVDLGDLGEASRVRIVVKKLVAPLEDLT